MKAVVVLAVSVVGTQFCNMDFCTLITLISIAVDIYEEYTHDKTTI